MNRKSIINIVDRADVSEKSIERYLCGRVKDAGGLCLKYSNLRSTGYPDRIVIMPNGEIWWVELKSKGRKPTKLQVLRHAELIKLHQIVRVIDSRAQVDNLMDVWQGKGVKE